MTTPLLIVIALLGFISLSALVISLVALTQARATQNQLAIHALECRKADGDIYDRMRTCNAAHNVIQQDIMKSLGRIEGLLEHRGPQITAN